MLGAKNILAVTRTEVSGLSQDFNIGYGLLVAINTSGGKIGIYALSSGAAREIYNNGVNATIEKVNEYVTRITKGNTSNRIIVSFLGYY